MSTTRIVLLASTHDIALLLCDVVRDSNGILLSAWVINGRWRLSVKRKGKMAGLLTVDAAGVATGHGPELRACDLIEVKVPDDVLGSDKFILDWARASVAAAPAVENTPSAITNPRIAGFLYALHDKVQLSLSKEKGRITGRAEYVADSTMYQVVYLRATGEQGESWFREDLLEAQT